MEDSRNIIKAIDALTLKAGGEVVNSKNITEAIDNLRAVYSQEAIGIDDTLTQEGLAADAKATGTAVKALTDLFDSASFTGSYNGQTLNFIIDKAGSIVTLQLASSLTARAWGTFESITIGKVPEGYEPSSTVYEQCLTTSRNYIFRYEIDTTGNIKIYNPGGAVTDSIAAIGFNVSYRAS